MQAKYALPRGGGPAPRTTRIFVARIPPMVSDVEFRQYFERFGQVQVELPCQQGAVILQEATLGSFMYGWPWLMALPRLHPHLNVDYALQPPE